MAPQSPQITSWKELALLYEELDPETGEFQHTIFAIVDDDTVYLGQLNIPKLELSFQQLTAALNPIPDQDIFPSFPLSDFEITQAPEVVPANCYIKRPALAHYDVFKEYNVLHLLPQGFIEEIHAMEFLTQHPHPHIIRYHGCRVRRGRITGIVLDRHSNDMRDYLKHDIGTLDKKVFMEALELAIHHLHSLGWAHNDLNPGNVLVNQAGMPILIDFGSSHPIGAKLSTSRGTKI